MDWPPDVEGTAGTSGIKEDRATLQALISGECAVLREEFQRLGGALREDLRSDLQEVMRSTQLFCGPGGEEIASALAEFSKWHHEEFHWSRAINMKNPDAYEQAVLLERMDNPGVKSTIERRDGDEDDAESWAVPRRSRTSSGSIEDVESPNVEKRRNGRRKTDDDISRSSKSKIQLSDLEAFSPTRGFGGSTRADLEKEKALVSAQSTASMTGQPSRKNLVSAVKNVASVKNVERAMGLTPSSTGDIHQTRSTETPLISTLRRVLLHPLFECIALILIFGNAVLVGVQADYMARNTTFIMPSYLRNMDIFFCVVFTLEVCLRLVVHKLSYFTMWGWGWNIFDMTLVVLQLFEEFMELAITPGDGSQDSAALMNSDLLRVWRVLRVVKVVRVLRVMRFASDLRLLVSCILHSVNPFFWSACLIFLIIYIYATYLVQLVLITRLDLDKDSAEAETLKRYFGSLWIAVLSLFQGLTGGMDWNDIVAPLIELVSPMMGFMVTVFMAFAIIALMNVVTGTFVETAIARAAEVKEINRVDQARRFFKTLDVDASGFISFEEIAEQLDNPIVQEYFKSINVDTSDAKVLFEVIDCNGSGTIDFEEFLSGCLRLQGPAKALDMMMVTRDTRSAFEGLFDSVYHLDEKVCKLAKLLLEPRAAASRTASDAAADKARAKAAASPARLTPQSMGAKLASSASPPAGSPRDTPTFSLRGLARTSGTAAGPDPPLNAGVSPTLPLRPSDAGCMPGQPPRKRAPGGSGQYLVDMSEGCESP